ncbi:MAG: O-antigen ligase family protein, partial [Thermoanaerobaculia bacterium]
MRPEVLTACLPAALLLLFAGWTGTFFGAAGGTGALIGHLALLICMVVAGRWWRDPLALGRTGRLLPAAWLLAVVVSWWLSPVSRAGTLVVLLLPAFACVPAAVAGWWRTAERRRLGVLTVSLVVASVAAWSLIDAWRPGGTSTGNVAMPLGHHNLLAAWLVTLLPVAVTPWWDGGWRRVAAAVAGVLGLAALIGTRSLGAAVAVVVVASAAALRSRRGLFGLVVAALLLIPQLPRLGRLADFDSSLAARLGYLEAGWRGMWQRPIFGWGPGATAWTVSEHLRPRPGVHPPDQIVADLHCLPLQIGYELGLTGLILLLGLALVLWRRWRSSPAEDPRLRRAALLGLAACFLTSFGGLPLSVTALPVAALVVLGMAAAANHPGVRQALPRAVGLGGAAVAVILAVFILPVDLAHLAYDRATTVNHPEEQSRHLRRAVDLDPGFPLYRARLAWLESGFATGPDDEIADRARLAAADAYGLAPLWLVAGQAGSEAGAAWSRDALVRACRLNPLGALAPFRLAVGTSPGPLSPEWGARAILSEPRLLAAPAWRGRRGLLVDAAGWASVLDGVDEGWRLRLEETIAGGLDAGGETVSLVLVMDSSGEESLSLHAFRRRPWPTELSVVELGRDALAAIDLVSAAGQPTT